MKKLVRKLDALGEVADQKLDRIGQAKINRLARRVLLYGFATATILFLLGFHWRWYLPGPIAPWLPPIPYPVSG